MSDTHLEETTALARIVVPVPDPTVMTTQAVNMAITAVREVFAVRFDALDKAIILVQTIADRQPGLIAAEVRRLRELHDEKFTSIQTQFTERDIRTEQTARDSKVAVDAALQAAKEAVGEQNKSSALAIAKSEASTTKQIDQISVLIETMKRGLDDKIDDIKTRITQIEGQKTGQESSYGFIVGLVGMLVGVGGLIAVVLRH